MAMRPRIAVNMWFVTPRSGGMLHYALSLLREFTQFVPGRLIVFSSLLGRQLISELQSKETVTWIELSYPQAIYDFRHLFDVLFTPGCWNEINMLDRPLVHVLPDIQEQYYPENFSPEDLAYRNTCYFYSALASTFLITKSEFSKRTIVEKFGVPEEKIRVTYDGVHPFFSNSAERGVCPKNLPRNVENCLFYPANSWKHKNHKGLLDALVVLKERYGLEPPVIFTGHLLTGDFNHLDIPAEVRKRGLRRVHHLGFVSLSELKYLYLHAAALVHPSLFEGFGIPLLEAMATGCPILGAERTSIPEVAGDAALYFNPDDCNDMAEKIALFLNCPEEAVSRVAAGKDRVRNFSDRRTAEDTLKVLLEAYQTSGKASFGSKAPSLPDSARPDPILTVGVLIARQCPGELASELSALAQEVGNAVQIVVCLLPHAPAWVKAQLSTLDAEVRVARTYHEALLLISANAAGNYIALSDGKSIPYASFVRYLTETYSISPTSAQLLHGYTYCKAPRTGIIRDAPGAPALANAEIEGYCRDNLSFVVRQHTFQAVIRQRLDNFSSMDSVFSDLWRLCSRQRVYRITNFRLSRSTKTLGFNVSRILGKLRSRFGAHTAVGKILRSRFAEPIVTFAFRLYTRLPSPFRIALRKASFRVLLGGQ
jgi:glycosyltransferase involved in cell wall biosynthesis